MSSKEPFAASVQRMDERLFGFRENGENVYTGSRKIILFPTVAGILFGLYITVGPLLGIAVAPIEYTSPTESILTSIKLFVFPVWLINQIFMAWRIFILRGFFKKLFYPLYVTFITVTTFGLFCVLAHLTIWAFLGIAVLIGLAGAAAGKKSGEESGEESGGESGGESRTLSNGVVVTRTGLYSWSGNDGGSYTENDDGSFTKN